MSNLKQIEEYRKTLKDSFEKEVATVCRGMKPAQKIRTKHELKASVKYQALNFFHNPITDKDISEIVNLFPGLSFPSKWIDFLRFSNGFFYSNINETERKGFSKSDIFLFGANAYIQSRQSQLNEIWFEKRFPVEFRRVLLIGALGTSDLGLWIHEEGSIPNEIIIFKPKGKNGYLLKSEFQVAYPSIDDFILYLVQSICNNKELVINFNPNKKTYTFKDIDDWPEKWLSKNREEEFEFVLPKL